MGWRLAEIQRYAALSDKAMTKPTLITIAITVGLALTVGATILTMRSCSDRPKLDTTAQDTTIYRTDRLRAEYEADADKLRTEIEKLTTKERENELQNSIKRSKKTTRSNANDVADLPFAAQGEFFTDGVAHLDSVKRELTGSDY
jgi:hypothetical protein